MISDIYLTETSHRDKAARVSSVVKPLDPLNPWRLCANR